MNHKVAAMVLACCVAGTSGCATIFNPGPDLVPVSSRPEGATVRLDGVTVGKTPLILSLPRDSEGVISFEKEGYQKATVDRDKVVNGTFFVNLGWILIWPAVPISMLVDLITGNAGKYSTEPLNVELVPFEALRR